MSAPTSDAARSALGRRGFLGGAAAVAGAAALTPLAATLTAGPAAAAPAAPADKPAPINPVPPSADSLVKVTDGDVKAALVKLDRLIKDIKERTGVPGIAAAVVHNDEVKFMEAYGIRDLVTGNKVTVDTVFQLASVSKPLAASAIARAVGQGFDWTDPIVKYLPDFALSDHYVGTHVTIEDMLSHRSGLPGAAGDLLEDLGYDQPYVLDKLRLEPLTPFRTKYAYSNFGYTAGAVAAAAATKQLWADFADANLFRPLGMTQASYRHSDFLRRADHTAMHVRVDDGVWKQLYTRNPDPEAPAGGATASVRDLSQWLRMELANGSFAGRSFMDPAALQRTHRPAILMSPPAIAYARSSFYGLGMDLSDDAAGRVRWSHSGAFFQGAATQVLMLPSVNLGIVILTNGMPIGVPEAIGASFLDYVEAGKLTRDWLEGYGRLFAALMTNTSELAGKNPPYPPTTPARAGSYYAGTYHNAFYGDIRIDARPDGLHLLIGPALKNDYPLLHWDGDVFSFVPSGENSLGITAATFHPGSGSQAASVTLEYYNGDGLGVFTR